MRTGATTEHELVEHARERAVLRHALARIPGGRGGIALLAGDAGDGEAIRGRA
jgi:hypothetical protein